MDAPAPDRTAVLVIRAWCEDGSASGLRARITAVSDLETAEAAVSTSASVDDICTTVRRWLEEFLEAAPAER